MHFTKAKTKRDAIVTALQDFNRRKRMAALIQHSGTCKQMMSFQELMELRGTKFSVIKRSRFK